MPEDKPVVRVNNWRRILQRAKHAERLSTGKRARHEGGAVFALKDLLRGRREETGEPIEPPVKPK